MRELGPKSEIRVSTGHNVPVETDARFRLKSAKAVQSYG